MKRIIVISRMIYNQSQNDKNKNKNIINNRKYTYNFDNMKN